MKYQKYEQYMESGVDWLGKIPRHWGVKKFKRLARLKYGDSLASEDRETGKIAVYGSNGVVGKHNKSNTEAPSIIVGRKGSYGKVNFADAAAFAIDTTYFID